jgi:hypothetical protein
MFQKYSEFIVPNSRNVKKSEIFTSHNVCLDEQLVKLYITVTVCWQSWSGIIGGKLFLVSKFYTVFSPLELQTICKHLLC